MGCGKSTIGSELAKVLSYDFLDLDNYIEKQEQKLLTDIFKINGEMYFRKQESKYLNDILQSSNNIVLALGGGTSCYGNNMNNILESNASISFYLKVSIPELSRRLFDEKSHRPLISHLKTEEALTEFIGKHIFERTNYYSQSQNTIKTDGLKVEEIIEAIVLKLV